MGTSLVHKSLSTVPLAELHVHLRGTVMPDLVARLAAKNGIKVEGVRMSPDGYLWSGLAEFLDTYHRVAGAIASPDDYRMVAKSYLEHVAALGAIYCEISVSPDHADHIPYLDLIEAVGAAIDEVRSSHEIEARIIVTCVRHRGPESAIALANMAVKYPHPLVAGFGMSGNELEYRPQDFSRAFLVARDAGLGLTAHVGEFRGPESIAEAIDCLNLRRIGHGVKAVTDDNLIRRLAEEDITLEMCVTSNLRLSVFSDVSQHPFMKFFQAGCRLTINTDDPAHFRRDLRQEYDFISDGFGFGADTQAQFTRNAIESSFCDEATKYRLLQALTSGSDL